VNLSYAAASTGTYTRDAVGEQQGHWARQPGR
jgi:hypothetical protein